MVGASIFRGRARRESRAADTPAPTRCVLVEQDSQRAIGQLPQLNEEAYIGQRCFRRALSVSSLTIGGCAGCSVARCRKFSLFLNPQPARFTCLISRLVPSVLAFVSPVSRNTSIAGHHVSIVWASVVSSGI